MFRFHNSFFVNAIWSVAGRLRARSSGPLDRGDAHIGHCLRVAGLFGKTCGALAEELDFVGACAGHRSAESAGCDMAHEGRVTWVRWASAALGLT